jgi:hypothetical protein
MLIRPYSPAEQVDPAVELRAIAPPLPDILTLRDLAAAAPRPPAELIGGILHRGCKMVLGGTSKSNKSWCLLDLAMSVAAGADWWGHGCCRAPVLYVNFELHPWAIAQRLNSLAAARTDLAGLGDALSVWNLRGRNADMSILRPKLEEQLERRQEYGLIILDPAYKLLGDRDENANGDIAGLMNEFEALVQRTGAAVVIAHHFAKGDASVKVAADRMSGAGAWARDPDSLVILTPHEEEDCFTVSSILRNLPRVDDFVVRWKFPRLVLEGGLDPDAIRRQTGKAKACTDREFIGEALTENPAARVVVVKRARELGMCERTADRYLKRLSEAGLIGSGGGAYWRL